MQPSKNLFQDHVRCLRRAAKALGVEVLVELDSMRAFLRHRGQHRVLLPLFVAEIGGRTQYVDAFIEEASHFAGWLPRRNPGWPASMDKLVFKRLAQEAGLRVPEFSLGALEMAEVVAKRSNGSFGEQVHGPFRSSKLHEIDAEGGEYFERFVEGDLLKIWCFESTAVCIEHDRTPSVRGNGHATLRELIASRARAAGLRTPEQLDELFASIAPLLRYDGVELSDVPPQGKRQRVEFRYGSSLMGRSDREVVDLREEDPQWDAVREAAPVLARLMPEAQRRQATFTIDAMRDREGRVWFLEMNANPTIHPLVYDRIVASLTAEMQAEAAASRRHSDQPVLN